MRSLPILCTFLLALSFGSAHATPVLNEILASNGSGITDSDGETSDWIEITSSEAMNLSGYALTDDQENLQKWVFPDTPIAAGGYILLFASGKDRAGSGAELHANFQLSGGGEYLALVDPAGQIVSELTYPEQFGDVSYGRFGEELQFFKTPTPGTENGKGLLGFVKDTQFSVKRGFHDEPFQLEITSETEGATIYYSLDGKDPAKGSIFSPAKKYTEPLQIDKTTVVRAMAKKDGWESTNTDTQTYLFLNDVVNQTNAPEGFPAKWGSTTADYEMDPDITGPNADKMRDALAALPSVSFVGQTDDIFGSKGIYSSPDSHGVEWERPISVEWINTDGSTKFQADCGLRIQGGYFRQAGVTQKHSFRLLFKGEYGPETLRADLIEEPDAAKEFDTIVFRAGANDGYAWGDAGTTVQFTRDQFGRRLAYLAGHHSPRGRFVNLYVNGLYWGLYNMVERPNEDFSASYYGGDSKDWDSINSGDVKNAGGKENGNDPSNTGNREWNRFISMVRSAQTYAQYQELKGLSPDGTRNVDYPIYLDESHYADYMIINLWGGNWDWPNKNFWFGRLNTPESSGFKHYVWDFENTMGNNRGRSPLNMVAPRPDVANTWVGQPHFNLKELLWYQIAYADRVQKLFFNDGVLTPSRLRALYKQITDEVEPAIYAETARWGDDNAARPHTIDEWRDERDWLLDTYLQQRSAIVLDQFVSADLYPKKDAPELAQHGGSVNHGFEVSFEGSSSSLYYTTDGSDPYRINPTSGAIELSETAQPYQAPFAISETTEVKARYFSKSIFGTVTWSALTEATFVVGTDGLRVTEIMYHPTAPSSAEMAAGFTSSSQFEYIVVTNTGNSDADLTGVQLTAGVAFDFAGTLAPGAKAIVVRDRAAFESRYGSNLPVVGEYSGRLNDAGDTLILADPAGKKLTEVTYDDQDPWPIAADGNGAALVLTGNPNEVDPTQVIAWAAGNGFEGGSETTNPDAGFAEWLAAHNLTSANDDDDQDGLVNYLEYVLGSDPLLSTSGADLLMQQTASGELILSFNRRKGATIAIEQSQDLRNWTAIAPSASQADSINAERERAHATFAADLDAAYLRLKVVLP